ncbi:hypothetical protein [Oscillibacter sp.]|uniref:hypothetical protein n=1 Tax=Oscillibacter sp. TaxID=1945593 RepID=UPI0028990D78|nr:hypothetical protein [Oscillibacter sp.]
MYNRYIRNDDGSYSRIPEEDARSGPGGPSPSSGGFGPGPGGPPPPPSGGFGAGPGGPPPPPGGGGGGPFPPPKDPFFGPPPPPLHGEGFSATLRRLLDKLHLDNVDSGDLILLLMIFFLFREEADEELLIALGLLLIL